MGVALESTFINDENDDEVICHDLQNHFSATPASPLKINLIHVYIVFEIHVLHARLPACDVRACVRD